MSHENKTILIIDDSTTLRKIVHQALEIFDFTIFEADGATEAYKILKDNSVDLMILDWHMPEKEGYDLFLEFKEHEKYKEIPVIMLTAEDRKESMLKAIRSGIRHYLTKPFTHEDLLSRVVAVLKL